MTPFERYEIEHLSPSSCGTFASSPAMFVLQKVLKKTTSVGAAAHRGTASEHGVEHGLRNQNASIEECVEVAMKKFNELTGLTSDPRVEKERKGIDGFVRIGLSELRPYGVPTHYQHKVLQKVDGLSVPILGYVDFGWQHYNVLTDLKTTWQLSSEIKVPHARQVSLYSRATGMAGRVTYCTPSKVATYELENGAAHFQSLVKIGQTIERFLGQSNDAMELASLVIPDIDHFYFNDPVTRQHAFEVWGI